MVSTYTTNKFLEEPARGDLVGTWDTAVNGNSDIIDAAFGGTTTLALTNSNVSLSSAQYRNTFLTLTGTITANIAITFPLVGSVYTVENQTVGTFYVTLQTTVAGSQVVACPPYEPFMIKTSTSGNVKFMNFGRVGSYWDYAGSSVPLWLSACTVPPYLNCDGTAFSSATYPALATILGGTTLPDSRGRFRAALNQGQSRITSGSSTGGVDGDTLFASGGAQTTTLSSQNLPSVPITDPGHFHFVVSSNSAADAGGVHPVSSASYVAYASGPGGYTLSGNTTSSAAWGKSQTVTTAITAGSTSPTNFSNVPPAYIGGLTLVRAA